MNTKKLICIFKKYQAFSHLSLPKKELNMITFIDEKLNHEKYQRGLSGQKSGHAPFLM